MNKIHEDVSEYYGQTLEGSDDLKTNACCTITDFPDHIKKAMAQIHEEVSAKYYGCGLTAPDHLQGLNVLDLGSGSGRDCYLLAQLVGQKGNVVGVDMTLEQLDVARRHLDYHRDKFGYEKSNVEFLEGHIEHLDALDLKDGQFDLIISNCVINLAADKLAVLKEAYRVLEPGGEFYFSDVYAERRIPPHLMDDKELYGECLSGALYWNDFENLAKKAGFQDPRIVEISPITVNNKALGRETRRHQFWVGDVSAVQDG